MERTAAAALPIEGAGRACTPLHAASSASTTYDGRETLPGRGRRRDTGTAWTSASPAFAPFKARAGWRQRVDAVASSATTVEGSVRRRIDPWWIAVGLLYSALALTYATLALWRYDI